MIKNILFDFDGVILDSMSVRDRGFEIVFSNYPSDQVEKLLDFHRKNGGLSRYVKIRYFFEEIRKEQISEDKVLMLAGQFSSVMKSELTNKALLISDTIEFIEKAALANLSLHIVSGSDQDELRYLCEQLDISHFFVSINGSPTPKKQLVEDLILAYGLNKNQTILIGDSINDMEAADVNNITFFGYNNLSLSNICSGRYIRSFPLFFQEIR